MAEVACYSLFVTIFKSLKFLQDQTFGGDMIRASLYSANFTNKEGLQTIILSLENYGMILDANHFYTLAQIDAHFTTYLVKKQHLQYLK